MPASGLANYWHPIASSEDIVEQPKRFTLLGNYIVAFRDESGVAAFRDLCIHRGAALSLGSVRGGRLACPYHGWQYDRTGTCVRIPSRPAGSSIPNTARTPSYQVAEKYGMVWVALADPVAPIPPLLGDIYGAGGWHSFLSYRSVWNTSASRAVENFLDFSHFPYVHNGLLGTEEHAEVQPYDVAKKGDGLFYTFEQQEPSDLYGKGGTAKIRYEYTVEIPFTIHLNKVEEDRVSSTLLSMVATPLTPKLTELYVIISRNHSFERDDVDFGEFTDVIMEQDRPIVESQRPEELPQSLCEELHIKVPDAASLNYRTQLAHLTDTNVFGPYGA